MRNSSIDRCVNRNSDCASNSKKQMRYCFRTKQDIIIQYKVTEELFREIGICGGKMIKNKYAAFVLYVIAFLGLWNLADYLYTTFITRGTYHFAVGTDLALPVVIAIITGYLLFLMRSTDSEK